MGKFGLIGFGALGIQIQNYLTQSGFDKKEFVYFDDIEFSNEKSNCFPFEDYLNDLHGHLQFIVCLGYKHLKRKKEIIELLKGNGRELYTYIHPSSYINQLATIEEGVIIYPMCNIDANVLLKSGTLINNSVTISHDSIIDECCFLAPGVTVSGGVHIKCCAFIGANSTIANGISINQNCTIGMATSVSRDLDENSKVIGNPMKIVKSLNLI